MRCRALDYNFVSTHQREKYNGTTDFTDWKEKLLSYLSLNSYRNKSIATDYIHRNN